MFIEKFQLTNFRSFASTEEIPCSRVNVILGANNSGKSSILSALYASQRGSRIEKADVRIGSSTFYVDIWTQGPPGQLQQLSHCRYATDGTGSVIATTHPNVLYSEGRAEAKFFPLFSRLSSYSYSIDEQTARNVYPELSNLPAVLDTAASSGNPRSERLLNAMTDVIGRRVVAVPASGGKTVGIYIGDDKSIKIDRLGAGVERAVRMLVEMIGFKDRIFLLEEPENDLHPTALKAFLEVIDESLGSNQLFVSTHSPIVLKYLAARKDATILEVQAVPDAEIPESTIRIVENTAAARREVLCNLGHELNDFDLYEGWLILEESSAERIICDYLIPDHVPALRGRLRTLAAGGVDDVVPKYRDFQRLYLYAYLDQVYGSRTWVIVDAGEAGDRITNELRSKFSTAGNRFWQFENEDFERYYPAKFQSEVATVLAIADKKAKKVAKAALLKKVMDELNETQSLREDFATSAAEVIEKLREIAVALRLRKDSP